MLLPAIALLALAHAAPVGVLVTTGTGDGVQTATTRGLPMGVASRTVALWVKTDQRDGREHYFLSYGSLRRNAAVYVGMFQGAAIATQIGDAIRGRRPLDDGQWHHLAVTIGDGGEDAWRLFVDGVVEANARLPTNTSGEGHLFIGGSAEGEPKHAKAQIADVRLWSRALSATEVTAAMNGTLPTDAALAFAPLFPTTGGAGVRVLNRGGAPGLEGVCIGSSSFAALTQGASSGDAVRAPPAGAVAEESSRSTSGHVEAPAKPPTPGLAALDAQTRATPGDVEAWVKLTQALDEAGDVAAGLVAAERALALVPDHIEALNSKGWLTLLAGNATAARGIIERVQAQAPHSPVPPWTIAMSILAAGDEGAESHLQRSLERTSDPAAAEQFDKEAMRVARAFPARARAVLDAQARWRARLEADQAASGHVMALRNRIGMALDGGRRDEAIALILEAEQAERRTPIVQLSDTVFAVLFAARQALWAGRYEQSHSLFERGLKELDPSRGSPAQRGEELNYAGQAALRLRRLPEARAIYEESLAIATRLGRTDLEAGARAGLGAYHTIVGDLPRAVIELDAGLAAARKVLASAEGDARGTAASELAAALSNAGTARIQLGAFLEARTQLEEALAIDTEQKVVQGQAATLSNLGMVSFTLEDLTRAEGEWRRSRALYEQAGNRAEAAKLGYWLGKTLLMRGDVKGAEASHRDSIAVLRTVGTPVDLIDPLRGLGGALHQQRRFREALAPLEESIALQEKLRVDALSPEVRRSLLEGQYEAYRLLAENHFHLGDNAAALRAFERARGRILVEQLSGVGGAPPVLDIDALRATLPAGTALAFYSLYRNPRVADTTGIYLFVLTRDGLRAQYDTDSAMAQRWRGRRREAAASIEHRHRGFINPAKRPAAPPTGGDLDAVALAGGPRSPMARVEWTQSTLSEDLIEWYRTVLQASPAQPIATELATDLHAVLVAPALRLAGGADKVKELIIVPDGALAFLPFDTLVDERGRPLAETTDVRLVQSLTVLAMLQARAPADGRGSVLAWGDPAYGPPGGGGGSRGFVRPDQTPTSAGEVPLAHNAIELTGLVDGLRARGASLGPAYAALGITSWQPLPGTRQEVQAIAKLVPGTVVRLGKDATEDRLKEDARGGLLKNFRALHFATHGLVVPSVPELSALVLAATPGGGQDGYLTTTEILALPLRADVVALSACETGLGRAVAGDAVVGLTQAFLVAGANGVAVSLWPVPDEETAILMGELYRGVAAGKTYRAAFNDARRRALQGKLGSRLSAPRVWGAFTWYGR